MGEIVFKNVCKSFGDTKVIENLDLTIKDGEFTVLVGASGCGKTTLLRMIAGIGPATSGELYIDGEDVTDIPPGKRGIAMVFQNYAIYPTMTVRENIEFGLKNKKVPKAERDRLIADAAETVGLTPYLQRKPSELSGGQRQRVALARAMVKTPSVFLLDEPLSNLDAKLRVAMRTELIELHHRLKTTFVYVTHDQTEAMSMADTIILMNAGKIQQMAAPEVIGTPPMNIIRMKDGKHYIGYRPEKLQLFREAPDCTYVRKAKILTREMLGSETLYKLQILSDSEEAKGSVMSKSLDMDFEVEQEIYIGVPKEDLYYFDEEENRIREADVLEQLYSATKGDK